MTIARLLLRCAQLWGEKPALIDELRDLSISFSQMVDAAFFFGSKLRRLGLATGDRVAILGDATPDIAYRKGEGSSPTLNHRHGSF
jgi:acyl-CoA synthetase (AMP-forming)/AMP-acid ligase II